MDDVQDNVRLRTGLMALGVSVGLFGIILGVMFVAGRQKSGHEARAISPVAAQNNLPTKAPAAIEQLVARLQNNGLQFHPLLLPPEGTKHPCLLLVQDHNPLAMQVGKSVVTKMERDENVLMDKDVRRKMSVHGSGIVVAVYEPGQKTPPDGFIWGDFGFLGDPSFIPLVRQSLR